MSKLVAVALFSMVVASSGGVSFGDKEDLQVRLVLTADQPTNLSSATDSVSAVATTASSSPTATIQESEKASITSLASGFIDYLADHSEREAYLLQRIADPIKEDTNNPLFAQWLVMAAADNFNRKEYAQAEKLMKFLMSSVRRRQREFDSCFNALLSAAHALGAYDFPLKAVVRVLDFCTAQKQKSTNECCPSQPESSAMSLATDM
jgi:hypothetical protein